MGSDAIITATYRKANAENFKVIEWLIEIGICTSKIDAADYLNGRAGAYAVESYRRAHA